MLKCSPLPTFPEQPYSDRLAFHSPFRQGMATMKVLPHVDSKPSPSPACSLSVVTLFWLTAYLQLSSFFFFSLRGNSMGDSVHHTDCFLEHMVFYQTTCVTQMLCPAKSERQYKVLSPTLPLLNGLLLLTIPANSWSYLKRVTNYCS